MDSIPLKEFIAESLKAIAIGVREAQEFSKNEDAIHIGLFSVNGAQAGAGEQLVRFNIALQAENISTKSASGDLGGTLVSVVTGKIDANANKSSSHLNTHSIEFSVPMHFNSQWRKDEC